MSEIDFNTAFQQLSGNPPFPWQKAMYKRFISERADNIPSSCNLPTGLGKTLVIGIWLIALANRPNRIPRRLVYVVNRRTVVDQTTEEVLKLCSNLEKVKNWPEQLRTLAISTLRGQRADTREWSADPSRPAVICGTVDMIGSRLLFSGYGVGFKGKPLHAGFLGQDVLLVHDEAHLEPAFQELVVSIEKEQKRCRELFTFRVMALSATSRSEGEVFTLTPEENEPNLKREDAPEPLRTVWQRITAKKGIQFHGVDRSDVVKTIGRIALRHKDSGKAILVFVRRIDDVKSVRAILSDKIEGVREDQILVLTGTLRGLERDRLAETAIFQRFLLKAPPDEKTVYLVCTSAGEVGIDISADHMVCDLTPYDSMAQRLGRVNRRGHGAAEIDVVYEARPDAKKKDDDLEKSRLETLSVLKRLPACTWVNARQEASPHELSRLLAKLPNEDRKEAFSPLPVILPTSEILFDAWALTTIRGKLPGRPPVEDYLHGVSEWEPPETHVAWRMEVEFLAPDFFSLKVLEDLLEDYPLKPHELLRGRTYGKGGVFEELEVVAKRLPGVNAWLLDSDGTLAVFPLAKLVEKDKYKKPLVSLAYRTVILPPEAGAFAGGFLQGDKPYSEEFVYDVADEWYQDKEQTIRGRQRVWDDDPKPPSMRLVRTVDTKPDGDDAGEPVSGKRFLDWYARPACADDDGSKTAQEAITWEHHTNDVTANATEIVKGLPLLEELKQAVILAARYHDLGKKRSVWQRSIGNPNPKNWYAKSEKGWKPREVTDYRHEFGSLLDVLKHDEFKALKDKPELQDLIMHLIAVHHGRGRPHFPSEEAFDPEATVQDVAQHAAQVPQRFARLQRKYGRWGLAYLESLLRAASARPSKNGGLRP